LLEGTVDQRYPSDLSIVLSFNVKGSVRCDALRKLVLKPWERLHGMKELALIGDIGDTMRQHLRKSMLEGPFLSEFDVTMTEYHSMGQRETLQKNFSVAQWWWTI
jgi:hypothetical protein